VVLKPDPQTPISVLRIAELASEAGFPPGAINIVPGDGPTTGAYLVKHPGIDKVAFTGSTKTGAEIMRLCSEPLKRVTRETGGMLVDCNGPFYRPTVLAKVENAMEVAQEEIFGPVVTVIPFDDEKDAIRIANDVKYGLFATVWTGDPARAHRVARALKSGMVGVNVPFTAFPGIPFGGYQQSGFGRELSIAALDLYLQTRA